MSDDERFTNIISNLPDDYDCEIHDGYMTVNANGKSVKVIFTGHTYVVGNRSLHFTEDNEEVFTILVPLILEAIDGKKRI